MREACLCTGVFQFSLYIASCCAVSLRHRSGAGISRSAAIVCAYLIANERLSWASALATVRQCHPVASPNPHFCVQLKEWAQARGIGSSSQPPAPSPAHSVVASAAPSSAPRFHPSLPSGTPVTPAASALLTAPPRASAVEPPASSSTSTPCQPFNAMAAPNGAEGMGCSRDAGAEAVTVGTQTRGRAVVVTSGAFPAPPAMPVEMWPLGRSMATTAGQPLSPWKGSPPTHGGGGSSGAANTTTSPGGLASPAAAGTRNEMPGSSRACPPASVLPSPPQSSPAHPKINPPAVAEGLPSSPPHFAEPGPSHTASPPSLPSLHGPLHRPPTPPSMGCLPPPAPPRSPPPAFIARRPPVPRLVLPERRPKTGDSSGLIVPSPAIARSATTTNLSAALPPAAPTVSTSPLLDASVASLAELRSHPLTAPAHSGALTARLPHPRLTLRPLTHGTPAPSAALTRSMSGRRGSGAPTARSSTAAASLGTRRGGGNLLAVGEAEIPSALLAAGALFEAVAAEVAVDSTEQSSFTSLRPRPYRHYAALSCGPASTVPAAPPLMPASSATGPETARSPRSLRGGGTASAGREWKRTSTAEVEVGAASAAPGTPRLGLPSAPARPDQPFPGMRSRAYQEALAVVLNALQTARRGVPDVLSEVDVSMPPPPPPSPLPVLGGGFGAPAQSSRATAAGSAGVVRPAGSATSRESEVRMLGHLLGALPGSIPALADAPRASLASANDCVIAAASALGSPCALRLSTPLHPQGAALPAPTSSAEAFEMASSLSDASAWHLYDSGSMAITIPATAATAPINNSPDSSGTGVGLSAAAGATPRTLLSLGTPPVVALHPFTAEPPIVAGTPLPAPGFSSPAARVPSLLHSAPPVQRPAATPHSARNRSSSGRSNTSSNALSSSHAGPLPPPLRLTCLPAAAAAPRSAAARARPASLAEVAPALPSRTSGSPPRGKWGGVCFSSAGGSGGTASIETGRATAPAGTAQVFGISRGLPDSAAGLPVPTWPGVSAASAYELSGDTLLGAPASGIEANAPATLDTSIGSPRWSDAVTGDRSTVPGMAAVEWSPGSTGRRHSGGRIPSMQPGVAASIAARVTTAPALQHPSVQAPLKPPETFIVAGVGDPLVVRRPTQQGSATVAAAATADTMAPSTIAGTAPATASLPRTPRRGSLSRSVSGSDVGSPNVGVGASAVVELSGEASPACSPPTPARYGGRNRGNGARTGNGPKSKDCTPSTDAALPAATVVDVPTSPPQPAQHRNSPIVSADNHHAIDCSISGPSADATAGLAGASLPSLSPTTCSAGPQDGKMVPLPRAPWRPAALQTDSHPDMASAANQQQQQGPGQFSQLLSSLAHDTPHLVHVPAGTTASFVVPSPSAAVKAAAGQGGGDDFSTTVEVATSLAGMDSIPLPSDDTAHVLMSLPQPLTQPPIRPRPRMPVHPSRLRITHTAPFVPAEEAVATTS